MENIHVRQHPAVAARAPENGQHTVDPGSGLNGEDGARGSGGRGVVVVEMAAAAAAALGPG